MLNTCRKLGGAFHHEDAREQRHAGHVTSAPPFVGADVAVTSAYVFGPVKINNAVELGEFVSLREQLVDLFAHIEQARAIDCLGFEDS